MVGVACPALVLGLSMRHGLFSSFSSLLLCLLAAVAAGTGLPLLVLGQAGNGAVACCEAPQRLRASLIADRLDQALRSVGRDLDLVTQSLAIHPPETDAEGADRLLAAWRARRPDYADILFTDRAGYVLTAAHAHIVGANVSRSRWFAKALAGPVIGEAQAESRAGAAAMRNIIVAAPLSDGRAAIGVAAVQLAPDWIDGVIESARRTQPDASRGFSVTLLNGTGHILHKSGPEFGGTDISATVGDLNRGGVGWLVTVRDPELPAAASPILTLFCAILIAGAVGWLIGGRLKRSLDQADALCRREGNPPPDLWPLTRDLHRLTATIRGEAERSLVRERLLRETRGALARSRDRVNATRVLSGSTCWEIDLVTGQVVWTDGDGAKSERVCGLEDILALIAPDDHDVIREALAVVHAQGGTVREMVVRTRAGTERISGRLLALRISKMPGLGASRLYALSREYVGPALSTPSSRPVLDYRTGASTPSAAVPDTAEPYVLHRTASALKDGVALVRDLASALDRIVAFARRSNLRAPAIAVSLDADLSPLRCRKSQFALLLLNILGELRDTDEPGIAVTLRVETQARDRMGGIAIGVSAPGDISTGQGLRATRHLVDELGGHVDVGGHPFGSGITIWLPAEPRPVAGQSTDSPETILILEPDAILRERLTGTLRTLGYAVSSVRDARQAAGLMATDLTFDLLMYPRDLSSAIRGRLGAVASLQEPCIPLLTTETSDGQSALSDERQFVFRSPSDPALIQTDAWTANTTAKAA